jgi:hypothetical protein
LVFWITHQATSKAHTGAATSALYIPTPSACSNSWSLGNVLAEFTKTYKVKTG